MLRLLLIGAAGYIAYTFAKTFVRSVPGDFEPVGLLSSPDRSQEFDPGRGNPAG